MSEDISAAMQMYLEVIYDLSQKGNEVGVAEIAAAMDISKSSVTQALEMLKKMLMIRHPRYGKVYLTDEGRQVAQRIRHKHDTLTHFFQHILQVSPEIAEDDACKIEHVISKETFSKLLDFLKKYKDDAITKSGSAKKF